MNFTLLTICHELGLVQSGADNARKYYIIDRMDTNRVLVYAIIAGIFLLLITPFVVSTSMLFPFVTGKNFFFRIVVEVLMALWLILAIRDAHYRPKRSWTLGAMAAFVGIMALANIFGVDPDRSFWSNFERMEGYVTVLHWAALFLVASSVMTTDVLWRRLIATSVGASVVQAFIGILQSFGMMGLTRSSTRVDGTLGNSSYLGGYLLLHIFFTLYLLVTHRGSRMMRYVYGVVVIFQTFALFQTSTRGSMLGLVGGLFLMALVVAVFDRAQKRLRNIAIGGVIGVIVVTGAFISFRDVFKEVGPLPIRRLASISLADETTQSRLLIWTQMAWPGFLERPLLGWGQENFNVVYNKYYNPILYAHETWFDHAHNTVFDWLISGGALGLLAYLSLFIASVYYLWRGSFSLYEKSVLLGLLAAYSIHNFFVFDTVVSYILFVIVLGFIAYRGTRGSENILLKTVHISRRAQMVAAGCVAVVFVWGAYVLNAPGVYGAHTLVSAFRVQSGDPVRALTLFDDMLTRESFGNVEIVENMFQAVEQARGSTAPGNSEEEYFDSVKAFAEREIAEHPLNARLRLIYGGFLGRWGDIDGALVQLREAQALSPRKQIILFEIGMLELARGNQAEGAAMFKEAFELEPGYDLARELYAVSLVESGDTTASRALIEPLFERNTDASVTTSYYPGAQIINVFVAIEDFAMVTRLWEARVAARPQDAKNRMHLAAAYLEVGRRDDAIKSVESAIALDPTFAAHGKELIEQIRAGLLP